MRESDRIRSERAERAALADLTTACPEALQSRLGLQVQSIDGALVILSSASPTNVVVNRVVGLGVEHPAKVSTPREIIDRYQHAGVERFFLHLEDDAKPADLPRILEDEGLAPARAWGKFIRTPEPASEPASELEVRLAGPENAVDFGRIAAAGFGLVPDWAEALAGLVGLAEWRIFMTFDGDEPCGCAALRIHDGTAWFDWAATRPEHGRRGSQTALLSRRISAAREIGCDLLATATGIAVPGEPQYSWRNIERAGFRLSHVRANWAPAD